MGEFPNKETQFSSKNQPKKNGRPKGKSISTYLKEFLDCEIEFTNPITKQREKLPLSAIAALKQIKNAIIDGDRLSINDIQDRLEGKPLQKQEVKAEVTTIEIIDADKDKGTKSDESENESN